MKVEETPEFIIQMERTEGLVLQEIHPIQEV